MIKHVHLYEQYFIIIRLKDIKSSRALNFKIFFVISIVSNNTLSYLRKDWYNEHVNNKRHSKSNSWNKQKWRNEIGLWIIKMGKTDKYRVREALITARSSLLSCQLKHEIRLKSVSLLLSFKKKYSRMDQVKFFKGCYPQILFGLFLNTLSHFQCVITFV